MKKIILITGNRIKKAALTVMLSSIIAACSGDGNSNNAQVNDAHKAELESLRAEVDTLKKEVKKLSGDVKGVSNKIAKISPSKPKAVIPKTIAIQDKFALGDKTADVMVIEYTDFQCGFCGRHVKNVFPQIKKNFIDTGKIRYAVRDYPLNFHKQAKIAAVAANCAGKQGKYWDMHEVLFKNPRALNKQFFKTQAKKLSLDSKSYGSCLDNEDNLKEVDASLASGNKYGVTGTPKFFVGRVKGSTLVDIKVISGAKNYAAFASALNAKL